MSVKKVGPTNGPEGSSDEQKGIKKNEQPKMPDIMKQLKDLQDAGIQLDKIKQGDAVSGTSHTDHDNSHTDHSNHSDNSPCL